MMHYLFLLFLVFVLGCKEEFPTYASFCSQPQHTFPCLHYAVLDSDDKKMLQKIFIVDEDKNCPFRVELTKYHVGECNNPEVKSLGSDFNGYVRVEIKKGFKCYYKVQSDFKHDATAAFKRVLERVKIDVNKEKKFN